MLFALDLANGSIRWQRVIDPPSLSPLVHQQRSALTIANGRVYVPYGGLLGDCGNYRGWVVASALDGTGGLLSYEVKAAREAGIWAPGGGVVGPTGDLFVAVGNAEGAGFNYGNSVIRLRPDLSEADYWAPANQKATAANRPSAVECVGSSGAGPLNLVIRWCRFEGVFLEAVLFECPIDARLEFNRFYTLKPDERSDVSQLVKAVSVRTVSTSWYRSMTWSR